MNTINQGTYKPLGIIKSNLIPLTILLSFGLLLSACSDMHNSVNDDSSVSDLLLQESSVTQVASTFGVEKEVTISGFTIEFDDEGSGYNNGETTFKYTVTRGNDAEGFNFFFLETPSCDDGDLVSHSPTSSSTETDDGIKWVSSMGKGESRDYSITYSGNQPTGMIDVTIQDSGSGSGVTKQIAGPCKGITTIDISGAVYVDENADSTRNSGEGGIENVTVHLENLSTTTDHKGIYKFTNVLTIKGYVLTLKVLEASNPALFDNFNLTQGAGGHEVTVGDENVEKIKFGFKPDTDGIIAKFNPEAEGAIILKTKKPEYWEKELFFSTRGRKTDFTKDELLKWLDEIEKLDLTFNFNFGSDKLKAAKDILSVRLKGGNQSSALEILKSELLAAKLNVVSGNGAVDGPDFNADQFNMLILKIGAAAVKADTDHNGSLMMNSSLYETTTFTITSQSLSSGDLLRSFNGGGGGVGN